jgi:hypothetical protein
VPIQKSANLVEIKAREKFKRRRLVDIPRGLNSSRNADIGQIGLFLDER